jgi:hypothetical protein
VTLLFILGLFLSAAPPDKSEKFGLFVMGASDAEPVVKALTKALNESKPFEVVGKNDSKVAVLVSCMSRQKTEPFVCMYVASFNGAAFQTFMGGGLYVATTADIVAVNFLQSLAADIVERFDDTSVSNARQTLEGCLFLSEPGCDVPEQLQKELGTKKITLREYMVKKYQATK